MYITKEKLKDIYNIVIVGAGPSGILAAIAASNNNERILLVEKNKVIGKKLQLTGGTRCNLTNLKSTNDFLNSLNISNKKFLYSTLNLFGPYELYDFITSKGVNLKIENNDKVFPVSNKSTEIIQALERTLQIDNIDILLDYEFKKIKQNENCFIINNTIKTNKLVIATGGLSYPQTGSTGDGYKIAQKYNHQINTTHASLVGINLKTPIVEFQGTSLNNVSLSYKNTTVFGDIIFTHFGISGPATLNISEFLNDDLNSNQSVTLKLNIINNTTYDEFEKDIIESKLINPNIQIKTYLKKYLSNTVSKYITNSLKFSTKELKSISEKNIQTIYNELSKFKLEIKSLLPIDKAIITAGGISTNEISPKTFESKKTKNLYFIGEVLDLHAPTGGYNLTIAFSTGYSCGFYI